jgi:hypothetical protein
MNKERKPTFNYILNDMALLSLLTICLYSEHPSEQDKYDLEYQVKLLLESETKLRKEMIKQQYGDIEQLQQENKQLNSILTELEEWLNLEISIHDEDDTIDILYSCVLNKIQELKKKFGGKNE